MKIYTRTGDRGKTFLRGGRRAGKDHPCAAATGDLDELGAVLGWAAANAGEADLRRRLEGIQKTLFAAGESYCGGGKGGPTKEDAARLEKEIDAMQKKLPVLRRFVLSGGSPAGAALHWARTVCRRAERSAVKMSQTSALPNETLCYLNRLSDYLFVLARFVNQKARRPEKPLVK